MVDISSVSGWFFGYDALFEFVFALITLAVSIYSFKIHRLSNQKESRTFGIAFLFISISYFIQSLLNAAIFFELNEEVINIIEFHQIITMNNFSIFVHMVLFTFGLITLIYMILGGKNRLMYLISLVIAFLFIFQSANKMSFFYVLSSLLLVFISTHYVTNYIEHKEKKSRIVMVAFIFLLIGHIQFIFIPHNTLYYILGHFLEFIAYILILINLLMVIKK